MNEAPLWGTGAADTKEKPHRLGPAGLKRTSSSLSTTCSAPKPLRQETPRALRPYVLSSKGRSIEAKLEHLLVAKQRIKGIIALLRSRHGSICKGPQARVYFEAIAPQLMIARALDPKFGQLPADWARKYTPELTASEQAEVISTIHRFPPWYTSIELGEMLCLTDDEREAGRFWWAAAVDVTAEQLRVRKVVRASERMKTLRASRGSTPREHSLSQTRPWERMDITEAAYRSRLRRGKL